MILALVAAMLATGVLGVLIERIAFRPLRGAHHLAPLATTIGFGIFLQETARWWFGTEQRGFPRRSRWRRGISVRCASRRASGGGEAERGLTLAGERPEPHRHAHLDRVERHVDDATE